jgi:Flp pilus assembly protein TadG
MQKKQTGRSGQTSVMFTLGLTTMFGVVGMVSDAGYAYYRKQVAQAAAQSAAMAAVKAAYSTSAGNFQCGSNHVECYTSEYTCPSSIAVSGGNSNILIGCQYAQTNGYTSGSKQKVTFTSGTGSASGVYATYWATVKVSETVPFLFSIVNGGTQTTLTARSTVGYIPATSGGCVYVIAPTGASLTMNGNTSLTTGCGVWDNSTDANAINLAGANTSIVATGGAAVKIVGGYSCYGGTTSCITPTPTTGAASSGDPLLGLDAPADTTCNTPPTLGHSAYSISNPTGGTVTYCGAFSVGNNEEADFPAGTYIFKAGGGNSCGLSVSGQGTIKSTGGVTFYFEGTCSVSISGGATVQLSAPTSGDYAGVLMFQDRTDTTTASLTGGATQIMNGIVYFPNALLHYAGGSSSTNASQSATVIAYNLSIDGNSFIQSSSTSPYLSTFSGFAMIE